MNLKRRILNSIKEYIIRPVGLWHSDATRNLGYYLHYLTLEERVLEYTLGLQHLKGESGRILDVECWQEPSTYSYGQFGI